MVPQRLVTSLQFVGAALGIPAAAVGSYSAYHTYFSTEATCQRLSTNILAIMERRISAGSKRALLSKDVTEFDKSCGESDPDARTVFRAALHEAEHPPSAAVPVAGAPQSAAPSRSAVPSQPRPPTPVFGAASSGGDRGWVALSRQQAGSWVSNFHGYAISDTSLPPPNTVLVAQHRLPVWSEMQGAANDHTKMQSVLPQRGCVRVLATRRGTGRLWAEIVPASCNGWVALGYRAAGAWVVNFDGYTISESSLPPAGTVLSAQRQLPVWSEPQLATSNDQTKLQNVLPGRACVRVLATRPGTGRLWAEVEPAACS
jgi:hypothetical protein